MKKTTTKQQDAAYILARLSEATKQRRVGEAVLGKGQTVTTISSIDGDAVTLANGERMHISKVRSAPPAKRTPRAMFNEQDQATLLKGVHHVWQRIGHDVLQAGYEEAEAIDNESAVESCIDADRLTLYGQLAAATILSTAIREHGYKKVLRRLMQLAVLA